MRDTAILPDFVIANGQTNSNIIQGVSLIDAIAIALGVYEGDATRTYNIQWSPENKATATTTEWYNIFDGGATVTAPAFTGGARQVSFYPYIGSGSLKLVASGAVASQSSWRVRKIWEGI